MIHYNFWVISESSPLSGLYILHIDQSLDYVTSVDLWSDTFTMDLSISTHPSLVIGSSFFEEKDNVNIKCLHCPFIQKTANNKRRMCGDG